MHILLSDVASGAPFQPGGAARQKTRLQVVRGENRVFSHIMIGVADFERAMIFYKPIMEMLGIQFRFIEEGRPWAGWQSSPNARPLFLIGRPYDQQPHHPGNGQMTAFLASSRKIVNEVHATALANGGACEGPPGLRPEYHAHYYGAYFRDPDGNKLAVVCHEPEEGSTS